MHEINAGENLDVLAFLHLVKRIIDKVTINLDAEPKAHKVVEHVFEEHIVYFFFCNDGNRHTICVPLDHQKIVSSQKLISLTIVSQTFLF